MKPIVSYSFLPYSKEYLSWFVCLIVYIFVFLTIKILFIGKGTYLSS